MKRTLTTLIVAAVAAALAPASDLDLLIQLEAQANAHKAELAKIDTDIQALQGVDGSTGITLTALKTWLDKQTPILSGYQSRMQAVLTKTDSFRASAGHLRLEGVNVYLRHSSNPAAGPNGLGNLILGANAMKAGVQRTGSGNIVIGPYHSYTGMYNIVGGWENRMHGKYSAILSGNMHEVYSYAEHGFIGSGYGVDIWGKLNAVLTGDNTSTSGNRNLVLTGTGSHALNDLGSVVVTGENNTASDSGALVLTGKSIGNYGSCSGIGTGDGGGHYDDYTWLDFK